MLQRLADEVATAVALARAGRHGVVVGSHARFVGQPSFRRAAGASIVIGDRFVGVSTSRRQVIGVSHELVLRAVAHGATIRIGDDCGMSGASVVAARSISIGDGCLVGADAMIVDTDFHPVDVTQRRYAPMPEPAERDAVSIGDNVFIGARALVLKGSRIGDDAVVGAGAVVSGEVPGGCVVAGNPAVVVRRLRLEGRTTAT